MDENTAKQPDENFVDGNRVGNELVLQPNSGIEKEGQLQLALNLKQGFA